MRPRQQLDPRKSYRWKGYLVHYADRDRIRQFIVEHPGCRATAIKHVTGLPWDVVRHHLHTLMDLHRISVARPDRKTKRYFVIGESAIYEGDLSGVFWSPHYLRLLELLRKRVTWRRKEILHETRKWGWKPSTTNYRLNKLRSFELVLRHHERPEYSVLWDLLAPLQMEDLLLWSEDRSVAVASSAKFWSTIRYTGHQGGPPRKVEWVRRPRYPR